MFVPTGAFKNDAKGIAFLEIILVVALFIVGAVIVSSAFGNLEKRVRDNRRVSDISQIQKALNIYYAGINQFPVITKETIITGEDAFSSAMRDEFMTKKIPVDPLHPTYAYQYMSNNDGSNYQLRFCLETESVPEHKKGCDNIVWP